MKTAWHMGHRIRLAMAPGANALPQDAKKTMHEPENVTAAKIREDAEKVAALNGRLQEFVRGVFPAIVTK